VKACEGLSERKQAVERAAIRNRPTGSTERDGDAFVLWPVALQSLNGSGRARVSDCG